MKQTGQIKIIGLLTLLAFTPFTDAYADPGTGAVIATFFKNVQGHYSGNGTTHQFTQAGESDVNYSIDLQVGTADSDEATLLLDSQVDAEGKLSQGQTEFRVAGDNLFYVNGPSSTPLDLLKTTETSLSYSLSLVGADGQIYEIKADFALSGDFLDVHTITSTNGVVVSDDEFNISRF